MFRNTPRYWYSDVHFKLSRRAPDHRFDAVRYFWEQQMLSVVKTIKFEGDQNMKNTNEVLSNGTKVVLTETHNEWARGTEAVIESVDPDLSETCYWLKRSDGSTIPAFRKRFDVVVETLETGTHVRFNQDFCGKVHKGEYGVVINVEKYKEGENLYSILTGNGNTVKVLRERVDVVELPEDGDSNYKVKIIGIEQGMFLDRSRYNGEIGHLVGRNKCGHWIVSFNESICFRATEFVLIRVTEPKFKKGDYVLRAGITAQVVSSEVDTRGDVRYTLDWVNMYGVINEDGRSVWQHLESLLTPWTPEPKPKFKKGDYVLKGIGNLEGQVVSCYYSGGTYIYTLDWVDMYGIYESRSSNKHLESHLTPWTPRPKVLPSAKFEKGDYVVITDQHTVLLGHRVHIGKVLQVVDIWYNKHDERWEYTLSTLETITFEENELLRIDVY